MPSVTRQLDNLYTTTWENRKTQAADNIFAASPFWFFLRENGGLEPIEGGVQIVEPVIFADTDEVKFIGKGGVMDLSDKEILTSAIYEWRYLAGNVTRFGTEDQQNRGRSALKRLVTAKLNNLENSLINRIEGALAGDNTQLAIDLAATFNGLQTIVPDNPAVGALGGIDPAVDTWWRSKAVDATGLSFTAVGDRLMRELEQDIGSNFRQEMPDLWLSGKAPYRFYMNSLTSIHQVNTSKLADAGFETVRFNGVDMVWSPSIADTRMYALNTRYLSFKYDPQVFFDMTEWKALPNQVNDRVAQVALAGNLTTNRRITQGVIHTVAE